MNLKFNNGRGALLCDGCGKMIATGFDHEDRDHFCEHCEPTSKQKVNECGTPSH